MKQSIMALILIGTAACNMLIIQLTTLAVVLATTPCTTVAALIAVYWVHRNF